MELVTPGPLQSQTAGSLLVAANTPGQVLARAGFGGHGYQAPACTGWRVFDACTGEHVEVGADTRGAIVQGVPFAIQVEDECTTLGVSDLEGRARALLAQVESAAVAREFWTGALATAAAVAAVDGSAEEAAWLANPRLVSGSTTVVAGASAAVPRMRGVAALEQAIGDTMAGQLGVIHMTRAALTHLAVPAGFRREGSTILTTLDTRIAADAGYLGTSPAGASPAAGEAWLYATARPTIWRSDVLVPSSALGDHLDRSTNHLKVRAERYALITLSCGVFAARITLES